MSRIVVWSLLALSLPAGLLAQAAASEKLAREAVERFMKAVKAEDLDATLKAVDLPFFMDGKENIKDADKLRKVFAEVYENKDLTKIVFEIKEVVPLDKYLDKFNEKERELLKEVAGKGDYIVVLDVTNQDKKDTAALLIRIKDGQAKVAGLRD